MSLKIKNLFRKFLPKLFCLHKKISLYLPSPTKINFIFTRIFQFGLFSVVDKILTEVFLSLNLATKKIFIQVTKKVDKNVQKDGV